jgi:hypothetical protein
MSPPAGRSTFLSGRRDRPNGPAARTNRENRPEITDSGLRARLLRLVSVLLLCRHVDALEGTHIQHSDFPAPLASPRSRHARRPPACGSRLAGRTVLLAVQPGIRYLLVEVGCSVMSGPALCRSCATRGGRRIAGAAVQRDWFSKSNGEPRRSFETADAVAAGERIHHELFHPEDSTRHLAQDSTTKRGNNDHGHVSTGTTPLGH